MIEFQNVSKFYGINQVLKNIHLRIKNDGIIGLIGSNGSGKTTFLRILSGMIHEYEGQVIIEGKNNAFNFLVSMNPEENQMENYTYYELGKMYQAMYKDFKIEHYFDIIQKRKIKPDLFKNLSKGNKQYVLLALTLSREVPIYIFDEPFSGLDVMSRKDLMDEIIEYCDTKHHLLIIASHNFYYLERLIDEVVVLEDGRICGYVSKNSLEDQHKTIKNYYYEVGLGGNK